MPTTPDIAAVLRDIDHLGEVPYVYETDDLRALLAEAGYQLEAQDEMIMRGKVG